MIILLWAMYCFDFCFQRDGMWKMGRSARATCCFSYVIIKIAGRTYIFLVSDIAMWYPMFSHKSSVCCIFLTQAFLYIVGLWSNKRQKVWNLGRTFTLFCVLMDVYENLEWYFPKPKFSQNKVTFSWFNFFVLLINVSFCSIIGVSHKMKISLFHLLLLQLFFQGQPSTLWNPSNLIEKTWFTRATSLWMAYK